MNSSATSQGQFFSEWISISAGTQIQSRKGGRIQSLEVKTQGSGHFDPHFGWLMGFECELSDDESYFFDLHYNCELEDCCSMTRVPKSNVRIWTFTLTSTMLRLYCRRNSDTETENVEVMAVSRSLLSHCCNSEQWESLLNLFRVHDDDKVTKAYKIISGKTPFLSTFYLYTLSYLF